MNQKRRDIIIIVLAIVALVMLILLKEMGLLISGDDVNKRILEKLIEK